MKKIAFLLSLLMIVAVVAASCGTAGTGSSSTESVESGESAQPTSEDGKEESSSPLIPISDQIQYRTAVSTGCAYELNVRAADQYPDSYNSELTDGIYGGATSYSDGRTAGFAIGDASNLTVVIDLGMEYDSLYEFSVSYLHTTDAGIAPPATVRVQYSLDGEAWKLIGIGKRPIDAEKNTMQMCTVTAREFITARYVRFIVTPSSYWMFFDEFLVFANTEGNKYEEEYAKKLKEAYAADTRTTAEKAAALASLSGDPVDRSAYRNEISQYCDYSVSRKATGDFPDKGGMLTDGLIGGALESETWVGFDVSDPVDITVDLGDVRSDIAEFAVSSYSNQSSILYPACIVVSAGEDPENMTEVGRMYGPSDTKQTSYTYLLSLRNALNARYVRFSVSGGGSGTVLLEECAVYGYGEKPGLPYLYPQPELTKEEEKYWNLKGAEATRVQNLLLGLPVQIIGGFVSDQEAYANNTPVTSNLLTDGKMARGTDIHEGDFFKFNRGGERNVIFDLGALSTVRSVRASILSYTSWAVYRPAPITVYLSDDTEKWYEAGELSFASDARDQATNWGELELAKPLVARYVCFAFEAGTWSASDEMEVIGCKSIASNAVRLDKAGLLYKTMAGDQKDWKYAGQSEDLLGGSGDICLMYHGVKFGYTEEDLLPYVGYLDREGNILDTMFDGFLFLMSGEFPSGTPPHKNSKKSDWDWMLQDLFTEGENLFALDAAAGRVNAALGTEGKKYNVFVTLYYLSPGITDFGDVDGDGVSENMSVLSDRMKVFNWFMDAFEARWREAAFENLSFEGYYWYHEEIDQGENDPDEAAMIRGAAAIAHERGTQFFWIPWYTAPGYTKWKSYGFDVACMQPNYAFNGSILENRLDMAVALIRSLGLCLEMEIDDKALDNQLYYDKYMDYLKHGVTDGYMNDAIHMYYQGVRIFGSARESSSEKINAIYDYTYQFIKKSLPEKPGTLDAIGFECAEGSALNGELGTDAPVRRYQVYVSPEHGTVSISENGTFTYYPDAGYTGPDTFEYRYSDQLFYSDGCQVNVTVK